LSTEKIREYAEARHIPIMRRESAELLIKEIKSCHPKRILEIGTAIGYSGLLMLLNSDAELLTVEIDEESAARAKANFKAYCLSDRVKLIIGDALEVVPCITGSFDFILLDGPKGHYAEMLPFLTNLLNPNGILFADNVLYMGMVEGEEIPARKHRTIVINMRRFVKEIMDSNDYTTNLISIEDGIIIGRKNG
jgi:predicted O-methyltransferase YrrM